MLRLRIRVKTLDNSATFEAVSIASSGFIGIEPEILIPSNIADELKLQTKGKPELYSKITGDGREIEFLKFRNVVKVYVVAEDRVEGPVVASALISPRAKYILLNDKLLSKLKISLLDFGEGIWCFRDEIGKRERKTI